MHTRSLATFSAVFIAAALLYTLLPGAVSAQTITLDNILPSVDENITPSDNAKAAEENFYTFWLKGQIGTEYTAVFNISEEPAFTFVSGGMMNLDENISYDAEAGQFSVTYTAKKLEQIDAGSGLELDENQTLTIIAVSFPVDEGEDGPDEHTIGSWVATNFQEWQLTTPRDGNNAMGARVGGDAGDSGRFMMFMPTSVVDRMAEIDEESDGEYAAKNLGIFEDDAQVSGDVQAIDGGMFIDFETTLPEESDDGNGEGEGDGEEHNGDEEGQSIAQSNSVQQSVTVAPRKPVSLTSLKERVKKGRTVKLIGWIKSGEKGQRVIIQKTLDGETYTKIGKTKTRKNGKFIFEVTIKRQSGFRAKYKDNKSDPVMIKLRTSS